MPPGAIYTVQAGDVGAAADGLNEAGVPHGHRLPSSMSQLSVRTFRLPARRSSAVAASKAPSRFS
jgi:hypothetical protein